MTSKPALHTTKRTDSLRLLSLALLLLCGFVSWAGVEARSLGTAENSHFIAHMEQLALINSGDNFRVKPDAKKDACTQTGDAESEPTWQGVSADLMVSVARSSSSIESSVPAPRTTKHLLHAPRAPPSDLV